MTRFPRFAALALGLALAGSAFAQSQNTPSHPAATGQHMHAMDPQQQLQHLTKQLQLTSDQQAKVGPILQQRDQQLEAMRGDTSLKPADRRAKAMSIMQDADGQIGAVLTPAQRDRLKAMREQAMQRMEERREQHAPAAANSGG